MSSVSKLIGSRVDQLDALELDDQLFTVFRDQLAGAFRYFEPSRFLVFWSLEVDAIIRAALLSVLLLQNRPFSTASAATSTASASAAAAATVGQRVLDLTMVDRDGKPLLRWKLASIALLVAGTRWFRERWLVSALSALLKGDETRAERWATVTDALLRLAGVVNFYAFVTQNRYPSLLYRLFGVQLHYSAPPDIRPRAGDFDAMSRELLWTSFAEFLTFLLPIINSTRSHSFFRNALRRLYGSRASSAASAPSASASSASSSSPPTTTTTAGGTAYHESVHERSLADFKTCGVCMRLPTQPHEIGCRHVYCYYCIASNVLSDDKFECPRCGWEARGIRSVIPARVL